MSTAFDPVVDEDPVANLKVGAGIGANLHHLAGQVATEDVGEAPAVAGAQVQVEVVEGASADVNQYLAGTDLRIGAVAVGKHIGAASLVDVNRFHGGFPPHGNGDDGSVKAWRCASKSRFVGLDWFSYIEK